MKTATRWPCRSSPTWASGWPTLEDLADRDVARECLQDRLLRDLPVACRVTVLRAREGGERVFAEDVERAEQALERGRRNVERWRRPQRRRNGGMRWQP